MIKQFFQIRGGGNGNVLRFDWDASSNLKCAETEGVVLLFCRPVYQKMNFGSVAEVNE